MDVNSDFRDLLLAFNDAGVKYLIVGGLALAFHDRPRFTKDLDLWVEASAENAPRVYAALASFGAPLDKISKDDFQKPDVVFQIGVAPLRVVVMTSITGVGFGDAWNTRERTVYGDAPVHVIGRDSLIANKRATGRRQDILDVERLLSADAPD